MGRVKNLDEIKTMIRDRIGKRNIFRHAKREDVESVFDNLTSKDPELWAAEWSRVAKPYEEGASGTNKPDVQGSAGSIPASLHVLCHRSLPDPHTLGKQGCYRKSLEVYEKAGKYFEPPLERSTFLLAIRLFPRTYAFLATVSSIRW